MAMMMNPGGAAAGGAAPTPGNVVPQPAPKSATATANAASGQAARPVTPASEQVKQNARVAMFRFGLGPKPGLYNELISSNDPKAAYRRCRDELNHPERVYTLRTGKTEAQDYQECCFASGNDLRASQILQEEIAYRYRQHMSADVGFVERLVLFWSNHFSMYREKSVPVKATIGHFERTVIRKHVLGKFSDMLVAAISHPAMIGSLDNDNSAKTSPNENLAREILELHTVGTHMIGGGQIYDQDSVLALAKMLTGWNINYPFVRKSSGPGYTQAPGYGEFKFFPLRHEESAQTLFPNTKYVKTYSQSGQGKLIAALKDLAVSQFTTLRLSAKLIRHFVTDTPTLDMIYRLNHIFWYYKGDLKQVAVALLGMAEAWSTPLDRIQPPNLWFISMARSLGYGASEFTAADSFGWLNRVSWLNNEVWGRFTPDGYPDKDKDWVHPNAMRVRVQVAAQVLLDRHHKRGTPTPDQLKQTTLPWVPADTSLSRTSNGELKMLADMFLSPEFMSR